MVIERFIQMMIEKEASDLFLRVATPPKARIYGEVMSLDEKPLSSEEMNRIVEEVAGKSFLSDLERNKNYERGLWFRDNWRLRVSVFYQRNTLAMVIRKIDLNISSFEALNLPTKVLQDLCRQKRGMVLLTGTTGSGKSTAIASMIDYINSNFRRHILSIEEPIEFTFRDKESIVTQREIGKDVESYQEALRQFALHSPDVIYIGNIRDEATMQAALMAADAGVLVFSTIHTVNAPQTIDRILSFFPPYQHNFVLLQLSQLLRGVVSLRLLPRQDAKGLIPAYEIMTLSPSISRLIREGKLWEILRYIEEGEIYGMTSFEQVLLRLVKEGKISVDTALSFSDRKEELRMKLDK